MEINPLSNEAISNKYKEMHRHTLLWYKLKYVCCIALANWCQGRIKIEPMRVQYIRIMSEPMRIKNIIWRFPELKIQTYKMPMCVLDEILAEGGCAVLREGQLMHWMVEIPLGEQQRFLDVTNAIEKEIIALGGVLPVEV